MNLYWIKDSEGNYLCKGRMKPVNLSDNPKNYRTNLFWSKYDSDYDTKRRIKYFWFFAKLEQLSIKILAPDMKTSLERLKR